MEVRTNYGGNEDAPLLLAEDDPATILLLSRAIKAAALVCPVHLVHDGIRVLQYLAGEGDYANRELYPTPVVLVLDIGMPRMDGIEVLRQLRQRQLGSSTLKIVLSGKDDPEVVTAAYEAGARYFLRKPSDFKDWVELLKQVATGRFSELMSNTSIFQPATRENENPA